MALLLKVLYFVVSIGSCYFDELRCRSEKTACAV